MADALGRRRGQGRCADQHRLRARRARRRPRPRRDRTTASRSPGRRTLRSRCAAGWATSPPGCWARGRAGGASRALAAGGAGGRELRAEGLRALVPGRARRDRRCELGDWDAAAARADAFICATSRPAAPHYLGSQCYIHRALHSACGAARATVPTADAELGLELGAAGEGPAGRSTRPAPRRRTCSSRSESGSAPWRPAEEFLAGARRTTRHRVRGRAYLHVLSWTLTAAGRGEEVCRRSGAVHNFPWARIGVAFARGDPVGAADQCAEIGALASEAYCRLSAARAGDLGQLEPALAFYRSVGATRYVREGESLLAASG